MKRKVLAVLALGVGLLTIGWLSLSAKALSTTPTEFLKEIPLQVSAYGWKVYDESVPYDSVTNPYLLRYVQLYNNSDVPLDMDGWRLIVKDTTNVTVQTEISLSSLASGWLAPYNHVVASYGGFVEGATYEIDSEVPLTNMTASTSSKVSLVVEAIEPGYQVAEHTLRLDSASSNSSYWQRNPSSTGQGYISSFSASSTIPNRIFDDGLYQPPASPNLRIVEIYPYSSTCPPNDANILCGDYIKLHVAENVDLSQFVLRTSSNSTSRTNSNTVWLGSAAFQPNAEGYVTVNMTDDGSLLGLTNSGGYIWLEDLYSLELYDLTMSSYPAASSNNQGWAWALGPDDIWQWTFTPRPAADNVISLPPTPVCPDGKYLNPDTGRCRTIEEAINTLAACPEGQTRNPSTNRCRQNTPQTSTLKPCGEGQERNPLTNRCRSIASAVAELIPCDEGQERNPLTNRCRKVTEILAATDTANTTNSETSPNSQSPQLWGWALVGVAAAGVVGYGVYEWRHEIGKAWQTLKSRMAGK